ncbi:MAG: 50S ribosomal protein L35 [candidate division WOR-3 bacterium]|nr:50S ribosomal protein L35 [candidate division WOR-3 bacterium]
MKMKLKTLSSLKKRVKKTATGKFIHAHSGTSHNNSAKTSRRKRLLHRPAVADETKVKALKRLLPY